MKTNIYLTILVFSLCACQPKEQPQSFSYSDYPIDTIEIDPTIITRALDTTEYIVEACFSLELKDGVQDIIAADVQLYNDRIYIMDERENKTVFVYDDQGHLLYRLGQIGHARNEFIGGPSCFSIERSNGNVHIYERKTARLLVFDKNGTYVKTIHFDRVPERVCITNSGNYLCSFCPSKFVNDKLALYSNTGEYLKSVMPSASTEELPQWNCFYTNDKTTYWNPSMSDFVLKFDNDTIQSVYKLDFMGNFIPEEKAKDALGKGNLDPAFSHIGVQFVEQAQMTDSLIHIVYANNKERFHYLQIRSKNKAFNNSGSYFRGRWPGDNYWISDDRMICVISDENIRQINNFADKTNTKIYNDTNDKIKKVLDGVIEPPVFVSVRIK